MKSMVGAGMIAAGFLISSDAAVLVVIECLLILVGAYLVGDVFWKRWWSHGGWRGRR